MAFTTVNNIVIVRRKKNRHNLCLFKELMIFVFSIFIKRTKWLSCILRVSDGLTFGWIAKFPIKMFFTTILRFFAIYSFYLIIVVEYKILLFTSGESSHFIYRTETMWMEHYKMKKELAAPGSVFFESNFGLLLFGICLQSNALSVLIMCFGTRSL